MKALKQRLEGPAPSGPSSFPADAEVGPPG